MPSPPMSEQLSEPLTQTPVGADPVMRLGRRTGGTMLWGQVAKALEALLTLAIAVAAVRALNPNAFGLYSLLTYLAGSASVLIPVVLVESAGAVLPRFRDARERVSLLAVVAGLRLAIIAAVSLVLLPGWDVFRNLFGLDPISVRVFLVGALYWAAQDLLNSLTAFHVTELDVRPVAIWKPVGQVVTLALIVYVAATEDRWSSSVGEVLAAVTAGFVVGIAGLVLSLRRYGLPRLPPRTSAETVLRYTRHTWPIGMLALALSTPVDVILIGALTQSLQDVAFYVAAVGVVARAQIVLLQGWQAPILPALGRARLEAGQAGMARVWELFTKLWLFAALPISVLLLVLAGPLIVTLFGDDYAGAARLLRWTAAFMILGALAGGNLGANALFALDRQRDAMHIRIATTVVNLALAVVLIRSHGALGAVFATGIAAVATAASEITVAARHGGLRYPTGFAARALTASALAALPALVVRPDGTADMVVSGVAGVAVYAAATAVLRPFGADDLQALQAASPRLAQSPLRMFARS